VGGKEPQLVPNRKNQFVAPRRAILPGSAVNARGLFPTEVLMSLSRFTVARLVAIGATLLSVSWASATYRLAYNFPMGSAPSSGLTIDAAGNAYGTTFSGGPAKAGTVYEVSSTSGYHLLYAFDGRDGAHPQGSLIFDSAGNVYGTTLDGGARNSVCGNEGCGVVFELSPSANGGPWIQTVLYSFCSQPGCSDGENPAAGVIFDSAGNLYGTTESGGIAWNCCGTVFELTPAESGWTEKILYSFGFPNDGRVPEGGLIFDLSGNLYGTTVGGGQFSGNGTVFELSPTGNSWTEAILYVFQSQHDAAGPNAGLIFDADGNLYGTAASGDGPIVGAVFELSPSSSGSWTETLLHKFSGGSDGAAPMASLVFDSSGNLYSTTMHGGTKQACTGIYDGCGTVFKLSPQAGGWSESLIRFPANGQGGYWPASPVGLDSADNIYGTTTSGGKDSGGIVFRITQ
jgi:uncharacterized repeat protein (TIGR03803 family)